MAKKTIAFILVMLTMAIASGTASAGAFGSGIIYETVGAAGGSGHSHQLPAVASPHAVR